jgi:hypothetical protein
VALKSSDASLERDALVDAGRLTADRGCWPVLRAADRVLLAVRRSVRSVHAAQDAATRLRSELGDLEKVAAVVVGDGPYSAAEVTGALRLPLAGTLPEDRTAAQALSDGAALGWKALQRSALLRAAAALARDLTEATKPRRVAEAVTG